MIIDLERFSREEQGYWKELEAFLGQIEDRARGSLTLEEAQRFYYLYQRACAGLSRLSHLAVEPPVKRYLESLVARAYAEVHEERGKGDRVNPWRWLTRTFPQTFRRRVRPFALSVAITLAGCLFGGAALRFDPAAKRVLMPFSHLAGSPKDRVKQEEQARSDRLRGAKGGFAADLMTHNTRVAVTTLGLGMTWGAGTVLVLFYNGVILGSVSVDYVAAGESRFLAGWLLPHGVIEIPAILIAGQAGLLLASALIGWGTRLPMRQRLRSITSDLVTLIGGVAVMLVWAGLIEAFFSQYHEPVLPYGLKIAFGTAELFGLALFLTYAGRRGGDSAGSAAESR